MNRTLIGPKLDPIVGLKVFAAKQHTGDTKADYTATFYTYRGEKVRAIVLAQDSLRDINRGHGLTLLRVAVIRAFSKITHVRLPSGEHLHVCNEAIHAWPEN